MKKKNVFFRALPELPNPPPLTPIWATWSFFFGSQNSRFESQFRTKNTIYTIWYTVYMQPKKQLKVQYIGIFEEIDSFYWPKMHFLKRGPKNSGMGRPPPIIRAMPERKRFFFHWGLPLALWFFLFRGAGNVENITLLFRLNWKALCKMFFLHI